MIFGGFLCDFGVPQGWPEAKNSKKPKVFHGFSWGHLSRSGASWGVVWGGLGPPFAASGLHLGTISGPRTEFLVSLGVPGGSPGALFYKPYAMLCSFVAALGPRTAPRLQNDALREENRA